MQRNAKYLLYKYHRLYVNSSMVINVKVSSIVGSYQGWSCAARGGGRRRRGGRSKVTCQGQRSSGAPLADRT